MAGKIICFEGIDGSGKTTQALKLKEYLDKRDIKARYVKMGEGFLGDELKGFNSGEFKVPFSTRSLVYAANMDYSDKMVIRPALENDEIVLLDRQYLTLVIYGTLRNKDQKWLEAINSKLIKPDITFILFTKPEEIVKNRNKKIGIFETVKNSEQIEESNNLVQNYISLQNEVSNFYLRYVDGESIIRIDNDASIDDTFARILLLLKEKHIFEHEL